MYVNSGNVSLYGSTTLLQNSALNDGGGISLSGNHFPTNSKYGPTLTLHTKSKFIHNIATYGGGISVYPGILQIDGNIQLINNVGEINGGGISIVEGIANFRGQSSFQNNVGYRGGGMSAKLATVKFEGNHGFFGNTATESGGGIWVVMSTVVSEETSILTLTHNIAYIYGGGIFVRYPPSELVLKGVTLTLETQVYLEVHFLPKLAALNLMEALLLYKCSRLWRCYLFRRYPSMYPEWNKHLSRQFSGWIWWCNP